MRNSADKNPGDARRKRPTRKGHTDRDRKPALVAGLSRLQRRALFYRIEQLNIPLLDLKELLSVATKSGWNKQEIHRRLANGLKEYLNVRGVFGLCDRSALVGLAMLRQEEAEAAAASDRKVAKRNLDHALGGLHPPRWLSEGAPSRVKRADVSGDIETICQTLRQIRETSGGKSKQLQKTIKALFGVRSWKAEQVATLLFRCRPKVREAAYDLLAEIAGVSAEYLRKVTPKQER